MTGLKVSNVRKLNSLAVPVEGGRHLLKIRIIGSFTCVSYCVDIRACFNTAARLSVFHLCFYISFGRNFFSIKQVKRNFYTAPPLLRYLLVYACKRRLCKRTARNIVKTAQAQIFRNFYAVVVAVIKKRKSHIIVKRNYAVKIKGFVLLYIFFDIIQYARISKLTVNNN